MWHVIMYKMCIYCLWKSKIFVLLVVLFSPPKNDSFRKDLCFTPNVFFSTREISEMRGPTGLKFCTMVRTRLNFIMLVQNFGGHTPKKFQERKTCKIWLDFGQL